MMKMNNDQEFEVKAPQDVIFDLPQERITGDILRGYGPRRGNLERLLRYWRPIMKKPGGFRRCRVILADHPELYPLNNICAWLHHETTGLWPNEGCHHPTMKNCRSKLKKLSRRLTNWSDEEFGRNLRGRINAPSRLSRAVGSSRALGKSDESAVSDEFYSDHEWRTKSEEANVVTKGDQDYAVVVLKEFCDMEPEFTKFIRDDNNWEQEGEDEDGNIVKGSYISEKCCPGDDVEIKFDEIEQMFVKTAADDEFIESIREFETMFNDSRLADQK